MAVYPRAVSAKRYPVRSSKRSKKPRFLKPGPYAPKSIVQSFNTRSGVFGFPVSLRTKLRYVENISMSSASGAMASNVFRANSLFDPNETGTGHQPMFFDTLSAVYYRYVVRGSRIKVTFSPVTETAATSLWQVGVQGQSGTTVGSGASEQAEQQHSVYDTINGRNGGKNQATVYMDYTPETCLNVSHKDVDVGAIYTSNPDQQYKFVIWAADMQATGTTNIVATVEIIFDCEFSRVRDQTAN